ncbi:hypothetical protein L226DRAFT_535034 [Lentinus tigrinus ALCF2SS1-7]|uniref:Uncharacterized protein n=1 Tax=Lentinus tigrinus ALCF2SS1-6 TaxID=1328759 RepID=A0A5C2SFH1_9APHY|nr:hypothetical protein L227DRAFT_526420 [Lentinus tigrinus ALCF2SS1-6]RPD74810.1 hypothetical protein L226DRAFT_535034 [Lentinus tigrinus ALCF2SS1-7]
MDLNDLNNLSEVESLSDSDWLDISSRASEDDLFADSDASDREDSRPPSRRSLASFASSREGEIHGWEGIVEDSSDEGLSSPPDTGTSDPALHFSQQSLSFRAVALSASAVARHTALEDPEEEQRVKDALDQSMVSTLSTSRSNSLNNSLNASVQTSVVHSRDLRLSFPDPLTSSSPVAHSLTPSYEDITADMTHSGRETLSADAATEDNTALTTTHPGSMITPAVVEVDTTASTEIPAAAAIDFYIVLYGASSAIKHRVVHRVLEKLMAATQCGFSSLSQIEVPQNIRMLLSGGRETHCIISIIDRTGFVLSGKESSLLAVSGRPSLAVIFLPSPIVSVPEHTLYLPVLTQEELDDDDDDAFVPIDRLLDAEHQWETMGVPKGKLVSPAFSFCKSAVIEEEEIERASPAKVARALRPLLPWTEQLSGYHLASRHAFTLFAILSIVLGYLVNGSLPLSGARRASPTIDIIARPAPSPVVNASGPAPATTPSTMALIPSSLKELALAAISPYSVASTSSVAIKVVPSPTAAPVEDAAQTGAPSECSCGCGLITWPEKFKPTTDLMLRPTPPTPSLVNPAYSKGDALAVVPSTSSVKGKGKARAVDDGSLYALSTRLAGALTEYLDMSTIFAQTRKDIQEILDALDELSRAISRQTEAVWEQSKTTVQVVRENIRARHERAKTRAKELRAVGERLLSSVSAQVRGRVAMAKENAHALRENVRVRREESFRVRREWHEVRRERRMERRAVRQERRVRRAQPVTV